MTYIIDGHNLIPKIRGLRLSMLNDEEALIKMLQDFCRVHRKKVDVYFDKAATGHAGKKHYGQVTVHFVREEITADEAIISRLKKLKRSARNKIVVSSDHRIISETKSLGAVSMRSEEFAQLMAEGIKPGTENSEDRLLTPEEIDEWMDIFSKGDQRE